VTHWNVDFENVADNLRESFRIVAAGRGPGEVRELRGVSIAAAGVTFQMFNAAFLSAPVENEAELSQRVLLPTIHFNARGLEWAYWVCEDWLHPKARRKARHVFEKHGLRHSVDLPGMVADVVAPPLKVLPPLEIRRVGDTPTRDAFCAIGSVCFNVPISWFREVFDNDGVWDRFRAYVAFADQQPVSTAAVVIGGGAAGVYNVATFPGFQRRGYGEAVMRYALAEARREHGIERTILQSTTAGFRLYQRMGYKVVTSVSVYAT
jgi:ribosomal protein S18 acetylase RimI-like enzyme